MGQFYGEGIPVSDYFNGEYELTREQIYQRLRDLQEGESIFGEHGADEQMEAQEEIRGLNEALKRDAAERYGEPGEEPGFDDVDDSGPDVPFIELLPPSVPAGTGNSFGLAEVSVPSGKDNVGAMERRKAKLEQQLRTAGGSEVRKLQNAESLAKLAGTAATAGGGAALLKMLVQGGGQLAGQAAGGFGPPPELLDSGPARREYFNRKFGAEGGRGGDPRQFGLGLTTIPPARQPVAQRRTSSRSGGGGRGGTTRRGNTIRFGDSPHTFKTRRKAIKKSGRRTYGY